MYAHCLFVSIHVTIHKNKNAWLTLTLPAWQDKQNVTTVNI